MVQMKANNDIIFNPLDSLYIPHGSDERVFNDEYSCVSNRLYIPHGSDESTDTRTCCY